MHLSARAYHGLGIPIGASKESKMRSQSHGSEQVLDVAYEIESASRSHGFGLDYNVRITYCMDNIYGAKIYMDFMNRFVIKIEDHHSNLDSAPWVNYQGDRYMGRDGVSYLFIDNPDVVDALGGIVPQELHYVDEVPCMPIQPNLRLINSVWTQRVPIDDNTRALYKREDSDTTYFYVKKNPLSYNLSDEKVLYIFVQELASHHTSVIFMDKYGHEWNLLLEVELRDFTYWGRYVT
ncbi:hypothetical protein GOP47_0011797 [Adiantum capillus-veneris]|uniref:Uncharacterized protein n=1 Tax=Adiantum capillus-veneris TaxID=13818 RepID=A0A9D4UTU7_ADICA|nr:hypothetical protein GOP47_0011797 [Adiantum capillus-veneris]